MTRQELTMEINWECDNQAGSDHATVTNIIEFFRKLSLKTPKKLQLNSENHFCLFCFIIEFTWIAKLQIMRHCFLLKRKN